MNIIFFGTPDFAIASLDILIKNGCEIMAVVTAPDKPSGRGQLMQQSSVKKYALAHHLKILQPENLKSESFLRELSSLKPDLQIVVAFRMLPEAVWGLPPMGTFNLHASLLPLYRGAAPINWAVINGERETGVTTFFLQHAIDTGNIIFQEATPICENETAGELHDRLMNIGANLVFKTVKAIHAGKYKQTSQNSLIEAGENIILKHAPKIFKDNCRIPWNKPVDELHNFIRGLSPYPAAFTEFVSPDKNTISLKILRAEKETTITKTPCGDVITDNKSFLKVAADNGFIYIIQLQPAGKKPMHIEDFLRGNKFEGLWKTRSEQSVS